MKLTLRDDIVIWSDPNNTYEWTLANVDHEAIVRLDMNAFGDLFGHDVASKVWDQLSDLPRQFTEVMEKATATEPEAKAPDNKKGN